MKFILILLCLFLVGCGEQAYSPPKQDIVAEKVWINGTDSFFALLKNGTIQQFWAGKDGSLKFIRDNNVEDITIKFESVLSDVDFNSPHQAKSYNIIIILKTFDLIHPGKTPNRFGGKSISIPGNQLEEIK